MRNSTKATYRYILCEQQRNKRNKRTNRLSNVKSCPFGGSFNMALKIPIAIDDNMIKTAETINASFFRLR